MKKTVWITIAVIGIVLVVGGLIGTNLLGTRVPRYWGMMNPGMMHTWNIGFWGWAGMLLVWLVPLGLLVLVVLGIASLLRRPAWGQPGNMSSSATGEPQSPGEILQIRYANGEITREQYLQMLEDLS